VNTVECEIKDPKQASAKRSDRALGWPRQKLTRQGSLSVVKAGAQTSYKLLKA
jgi:hypothetical protein